MTQSHNMSKREQVISMLLGALLLLLPMTGYAQAQTPSALTPPTEEPAHVIQIVDVKLDTLNSFIKLRISILQDIKSINQQIRKSQSDSEKQNLKLELQKLESDLRAITKNFENIAAGIDITSLSTEAVVEFNIQRDFSALLKPTLDEMKEMTAHVRQISDLREKITNYEERLPASAP